MNNKKTKLFLIIPLFLLFLSGCTSYFDDPYNHDKYLIIDNPVYYGGLWMHNDSAAGSILTTNFQNITGLICGYYDEVYCNASAGRLTILTASIYEVTQMTNGRAGNNVIVDSCVAINGVVQENTCGSIETVPNFRTSTFGEGRVKVSVGDNLTIVIKSSQNITGYVYQVNMVIKRLGD